MLHFTILPIILTKLIPLEYFHSLLSPLPLYKKILHAYAGSFPEATVDTLL